MLAFIGLGEHPAAPLGCVGQQGLAVPGCALTLLSLQDLIKVHHSFLRAIDVSMMAGGSTLAKVFLEFKER